MDGGGEAGGGGAGGGGSRTGRGRIDVFFKQNSVLCCLFC